MDQSAGHAVFGEDPREIGVFQSDDPCGSGFQHAIEILTAHGDGTARRFKDQAVGGEGVIKQGKHRRADNRPHIPCPAACGKGHGVTAHRDGGGIGQGVDQKGHGSGQNDARQVGTLNLGVDQGAADAVFSKPEGHIRVSQADNAGNSGGQHATHTLPEDRHGIAVFFKGEAVGAEALTEKGERGCVHIHPHITGLAS
ncbi:hypothetical protein [Desulfatiferula olefinivorans]